MISQFLFLFALHFCFENIVKTWYTCFITKSLKRDEINMKYVVDIHTHTVVSQHAYSTIYENTKAANQKGLELIATTDHAPGMKNTAPRAFFTNYHVLPHTLNGVELLHGAELNIMDYDGNIDLENDILQKLDIAIASLHPPCIPFGTMQQNTRACIKAMENPLIDVLGHPGDPRYPIDVKEIVKISKQTKCLIEINNASLVPNGFRQGSDVIIEQILKYAMEYETPIVLGSDAHFYMQIGDFSYCNEILEKVHFPEELIVNTSTQKLKKALKRNQ